LLRGAFAWRRGLLWLPGIRVDLLALEKGGCQFNDRFHQFPHGEFGVMPVLRGFRGTVRFNESFRER
jgi:hypothetical protein